MQIEQLGPDVRLHPAGRIRGVIRPPGSKSLTNRYLTCAALAADRTILDESSPADDAHRMIAALRQLGIPVEIDETRPQQLLVHGCGGNLPAEEADLDVGDAGTVLRFVTALACLGHGRFRVDGSPRIRERPIAGLVSGLAELGAQIGYDDRVSHPPITMAARGLIGGQVIFRSPPSSQFISALLMVAPYASNDVFLAIEDGLPSQPYVEMTIQVMRSMGVEVLEADGRFVVAAGQRYQAGQYDVEPDASAATYFWALAAVTGGAVEVQGLRRTSVQGDLGFLRVLEQMGCTIDESTDSITVRGPGAGQLQGIDVDLNTMPDTVQTLAVTALFANGPTTIRNVANLRFKETDRLAALATELSKLRVRVETRADGLTVHPPAAVEDTQSQKEQPAPVRIATYNDHRMAMSFAIAGAALDGIIIENAGCVSKSFPGFFEALADL